MEMDLLVVLMEMDLPAKIVADQLCSPEDQTS